MHCVAGVQAVKVVSEPSSLVLLGRGAGCLSSVRTYLAGPCVAGVQGCFSDVGIYLLLLGTLLQVCTLLKQWLNLPARQCVAVGQAV